MPNSLDIHLASPDELIAAHRNVFDIWSKGLSLDDHVRYRLNSASHRWATWLVGCLDGRVVTSLGCYPMRFRILGEELPGIAIGSVYTVREFRGRGLAPRLIRWVEDLQPQAALSILYSDIGADYYARRGYVLCQSLQGWRDPQSEIAPSAAGHWTAGESSEILPCEDVRLTHVSPESHLPEMMELYADHHGAMPLSIVRDADYWGMLVARLPEAQFYALRGHDEDWLGYVRIWPKQDAWRIVDYALADQSDALAEQLYAALLNLACLRGITRVGGWLPDTAAARRFFSIAPRQTELTMVKPLAWQGEVSADMIAAAGRLCEIDHV